MIKTLQEYTKNCRRNSKPTIWETCLGIEFTSSKNFLRMNKEGCIDEIINKFDMTYAKPVKNSMGPLIRLMNREESADKNFTIPYHELIVALTHLSSIIFRVDINFTVNRLAQFSICYSQVIWKTAKRILRYLQGSMDLSIEYRN